MYIRSSVICKINTFHFFARSVKLTSLRIPSSGLRLAVSRAQLSMRCSSGFWIWNRFPARRISSQSVVCCSIWSRLGSRIRGLFVAVLEPALDRA